MRCIIVDDEMLSRLAIEGIINNFDFLELLEQFDEPFGALEFLKHNPVDIVFLDVEMPGMTGIEMINKLQIDPMPQFIMISSHEKYAIQALNQNVAIHYIIKPLDYPSFAKAVNKAREVYEAKQAQ